MFICTRVCVCVCVCVPRVCREKRERKGPTFVRRAVVLGAEVSVLVLPALAVDRPHTQRTAQRQRSAPVVRLVGEGAEGREERRRGVRNEERGVKRERERERERRREEITIKSVCVCVCVCV